MLPYDFDSVKWSMNHSNLSIYDDSFCSVVLETHYALPMFTEKILRPLAHGHPFLLFSYPGNLKVLKDIGFKTFSDVFDGITGGFTT